jgi:hypothetical protein
MLHYGSTGPAPGRVRRARQRQRPAAAGARVRAFVASDGKGGTAPSGEMALSGNEGASAEVAPGYGMGGTAPSAVLGSG